MATSNRAKTAGKVVQQPLNANTLRTVLWETLHGLKNNTIAVETADAIAHQSREILLSFKVQLQIAVITKRRLGKTAKEFNI